MTIGNLLVVTGFQPVAIQILTHAHPPRIGNQAARMPWLYHLLARISSVILARRQLLAVARLAM